MPWPFTNRKPIVPEALLEQQTQIHGLAQEVKALRDDLASLEDKHERLRGKFYAARQDTARPGALTKEQILANYRANQAKG